MNIKYVVFAMCCSILQTCSQAAVVNGSMASSKLTDIDPASFVTIGDKQYYISPITVEVTALEATRLCNDDRMRLLSFENEEKMREIYEYLNNNGYELGMFWLSGQRWEHEWQWTGSGQMFTYTDWSYYFPNYPYSGIACMLFRPSTGWYDTGCHFVNSFMCEY